MRLRRRTTIFSTVALVALFGVACASAPETAEPGPTRIMVDNRKTGISDVTVSLIPENGVEDRLGTVTLGEARIFTLEDLPPARRYVLTASFTGTEIASRAFTFTPGDQIRWDLDDNELFFDANLEIVGN